MKEIKDVDFKVFQEISSVSIRLKHMFFSKAYLKNKVIKYALFKRIMLIQ